MLPASQTNGMWRSDWPDPFVKGCLVRPEVPSLRSDPFFSGEPLIQGTRRTESDIEKAVSKAPRNQFPHVEELKEHPEE